jgi:hypothetical protein
MMDCITKLCEERSLTISQYESRQTANQDNIATSETTIEHTLFDGTPYTPSIRKRGWALKSSAKQYPATTEALEFVLNLPSPNTITQKIPADTAVTLMKEFGTVQGQNRFPNDPYWRAKASNTPTFKMFQRLDVYQFKAYFGKARVELEKLLQNSRARQQATSDGIPACLRRLINERIVESTPDAMEKVKKLYDKYTSKVMRDQLAEKGIEVNESTKKVDLFHTFYIEVLSQLTTNIDENFTFDEMFAMIDDCMDDDIFNIDDFDEEIVDYYSAEDIDEESLNILQDILHF